MTNPIQSTGVKVPQPKTETYLKAFKEADTSPKDGVLSRQELQTYLKANQAQNRQLLADYSRPQPVDVKRDEALSKAISETAHKGAAASNLSFHFDRFVQADDPAKGGITAKGIQNIAQRDQDAKHLTFENILGLPAAKPPVRDSLNWSDKPGVTDNLPVYR
jgi:hypothetical protein